MVRCGQCRYYQKEDLSDLFEGECHRHSPRVKTVRDEDSVDVAYYAVWPWVNEDHWCGEAAPKESA